MKLADRSPGLLMVLAAVVVYGTILVEIGMWMNPTWLAMFATLGLGIVLAVGICAWLFSLLGDEDGRPQPATPKPAPKPARAQNVAWTARATSPLLSAAKDTSVTAR